MSLGEDIKPNDTIMTMVNQLKPKTSSEMIFNFDSPVKRPASSNSSIEEMASPSIKKLKQDFKPSGDIFYIGSPREVRRIRSDLLESRNTIKTLEKRIAHMHTVRKEMEIMFEHETKGLKSQQIKDRENIAELENQLQSIRKREKAVKDELYEFKEKYKNYKEESSMRINDLEANVANLSTELNVQNSEEGEKVLVLERKVEELQFIYKAAQEETDAYKKFVDELNKKLSDRTNLESELEIQRHQLQKAEMKIKELEFNKESIIETQQQCKLQQHKLSTYDELERENKRLKDETKNLKNEVYNKLVLEEEVSDLKNRLLGYKDLDKKYTNLQVVHTQAELYLEEFRLLGRMVCDMDGTDASLPRLLRSSMEHLQQQEINLTADKIQLESQLSSALHECKVARDELEKIQKHMSDMQGSIKHHKNLFHRMQKKLALVSGERDSYRKQLDTYEKDLTICLNPASLANPGVTQLQSQHERIVNLEKAVEGYRDMVHKLETDLQSVEPNLHPDVTPIKEEQLMRLQEDLNKLKNDNQVLRNRKDQLEIQLEELLVGEDKAQGRIVHAAKNPLSDCLKQREDERENLLEEIDRLKRKIRKLEEGLEASKLGDTTIDHKDVQNLKEELRSSEQKLLKLKEYFKNSLQEFRNVIYMLLGYKIDKTSNSQYKLTSMYADNTEDNICFHLNNDGALNLLENEFSSTLEEMVELHLRHQRSIPVFLSALTMNLFNNKTMTKTYNVDDDDEEDDDEDDEEEEEEEEEERGNSDTE